MDYHHNKSKIALDSGFICIHVFDWMDPIDLILHLQYSQYFSIQEQSIQCHWFNEHTECHLITTNSDGEALLSSGYLPVYDDGYTINFIYKGGQKDGKNRNIRNFTKLHI